MNNKSGMIPMPEGIILHNACNYPCDMAEGPCACGAWHKMKDWKEAIRSRIVDGLRKEKIKEEIKCIF